MHAHGKLKASYTVEMALVLPIVFGIMFAVLFLILIMFQSAAQLAIINMYALYGTNYVTGPYSYIEDGAADPLIKGRRDKYGYIIEPLDNILKNGLSIYNIYNDIYVGNYIENTLEPELKTAVQNNLKIIQILRLEADSVTTKHGASVMIRGRMTARSRLLSQTANGASIQTSGVASIISPSKYIRETDSKSAILTAWTTNWDDQLDEFLSVYLADLFTKGTFPD